MPPAARIPHALKTRPFSLDEARALGLNPRSLTTNHWRRLGASLYCWASLAPDTGAIIGAWRRMLPAHAVFAGRTAAWLHGLEVEPAQPVEVALPLKSELRPRQGLSVWRCDVDPAEVAIARGIRATTLPRTLLDLCARRPPLEALIALDMACRMRMTWDVPEFSGRPGAARLRRLTGLAAPAESPMETRLRWLLITAGLPRPEVQVDLHDSRGRFIARADLFYRDARLVIEFDGGNHRERMIGDDRRQNLITGAGFRLLRFTSADVYQRADVVVAQVRGALATPALSGPG
jgi:very-short-patch-repair endonuclease